MVRTSGRSERESADLSVSDAEGPVGREGPPPTCPGRVRYRTASETPVYSRTRGRPGSARSSLTRRVRPPVAQPPRATGWPRTLDRPLRPPIPRDRCPYPGRWCRWRAAERRGPGHPGGTGRTASPMPRAASDSRTPGRYRQPVNCCTNIPDSSAASPAVACSRPRPSMAAGSRRWDAMAGSRPDAPLPWPTTTQLTTTAV